jgi:N-acetylmuramoyl-L-alanine amidase
MCNYTERELKRHGITVYRNKPSMSLTEIVKDSNHIMASIHFAIHTNAYNQKSRGCEEFCYKFGGEGHRLAKCVYNLISQLTPVPDRGIKEGFNFYGTGKHMYELAYTKMPASLIEVSFHDNEDDVRWLLDNLELIGITIAKGILEYFGVKYIEEKKTLYSVQSGSFSSKENANNLIKYLNTFGVDGIIKEV